MSRRLAALTLAGLLAGAAAWFFDRTAAAHILWAITTALVFLPLVWTVIRDLRHGEIGVDVIALLAMAGSLLLGEYLAGAVIALMLSGGQALEAFADARARRELSALLARAPRVVHRYENGGLVSPPIESVRPGDLLLVKPGEIVPVDGLVEGAAGAVAVLDESALTGESRPVEHPVGDAVSSGTVNSGSPFDLRAVTTAAESTYAGIVRLVEAAQTQKAPFVRLADRYAVIFLPVTLVVAGLAWLLSGDPVRALAVLVIATPCPLILAAPVAIMAGVSRAAARGVIIKGGGPLETLARATVLFLDKTGTLTTGTPTLASVETFADCPDDELLRLAASLDQVSPHVMAASLVRGARERQLALALPTEVKEILGRGIQGQVDGRSVALGKFDWVAGSGPFSPAVRQIRRQTAFEGSSAVWVAVDGNLAGALILHDPVRPDSPATLRALRRAGIERVIMVTGDLPEVAQTVGAGIGADLVLAERSPEEKVAAIQMEHGRGTTVMVGDGVNDAPALAAADVGVAMGARGATASSEAADVVITVDRLDRLAEAMVIAKRARRIALESVLAGMILSFAGMVGAAFGLLTPVAGAVLQEVIDVAVILNALRALGGGRQRPRGSGGEVADGYRAEHRSMLPEVESLRHLADRLDELAPGAARVELAAVRSFLEERLVPHEQREDAVVYPLVARLIGGEDPTGTMSRAHLEIAHLTRLFGRLLDDIQRQGDTPLAPEDLRDLRRLLYGLHATLRLHFAQEDEQYLPLLEAVEAPQ